MAEETTEDKTEKPTNKRLEKAREGGDVPQSMEGKAVATLIAALIVVGMMAPGITRDMGNVLVPLIDHPHQIPLDQGGLSQLTIHLVWSVAKVMALPFLVIMATVIAVSVFQSKGFLWVPSRLALKFDKLNPITGFQRMFSMNQIVDMLKQTLKICIIGAVLTWILISHIPQFKNLPSLEILGILTYIHDQVYWLILITVVLAGLLALADYLYQHWRWMEKMKMSRQEIKDEHKQSEGDPMIKGRLRNLRMRRARKRMMAAVPKATVVVTNPTHYAVALRYEPESMGAPVLVAKGVDFLAKNIRELAEQNNVPLVENPPLARALYATVELDQEVPPEHYKAVAEIIGYVMRLKKQTLGR